MIPIKNMSIRFKTIATTVFGLVSFMAFTWMNTSFNMDSNLQLARLKSTEYVLLQGVYELQMSLADIERTYEYSFLEADNRELNKGRNLVLEAKSKISELQLIAPDAHARLEKIRLALNTYATAVDEYTKDFIDGRLDDSVIYEVLEQVNKKRSFYEHDLRNYTELIGLDFSNTITHIQEEGDLAVNREIAVGASMITVVVAIAFFLVSRLLMALNHAVSVANEIKKGNLDIEINCSFDAETKRVLEALYTMRDHLKEQKQMVDLTANNQQRLSRLNDAMRGDLTLQELSQQVLSSMAEEFDVLVARLFCLDGDRLEYVSGYAFDERSNRKTTYMLGESLVGQCALDKKVVHIDNIPEDYLKISSAVGRSDPRRLIIFPLVHNYQLKGVIELATFSAFDEEMESYISGGSEGVAIAVSAAISREKLSEMLLQTQAQATAMENQQEELRVTNEELEGQARELRSSEENLQAQQEELRVMNEELEERTRMLDFQKQEILKKNVALEKTKEIMIQKTDQLEMSGKYKSEFLSTMSHELRTPLNSILILSQGLINNNKKTLTEKEVEHAQVIHSSGEDLLSLINDILDLSKVEEGKFELIVDEVTPDELMSVINQQFSYEAEKKGIELKLHIGDVPGMLYLDRHRLNQILRNFLSNAFKFTSRGSVEISILREDKHFKPERKNLLEGEYFVIKVKDTGIGIPMDKQKSIFEAFQQADGTTSREYGGTGLGLTISKELSHIMGGEIKVHSDGEGKGSTFALFLPVSHQVSNVAGRDNGGFVERRTSLETSQLVNHYQDNSQQENQLQANLETTTSNNPTKVDERAVLIIEDDNSFATILAELAEGFGLNPWIESNGEAALALLQEKLPGSIILDLGLPGIGGIAILEILKNNNATKEIPVHVISGRDESASVLAMGAVDLLNKPADKNSIEGLFQKIKQETLESAKRLLIIEDDPVQQQALHDLFSVNDVYFDVVDNGAEAERLLRANDYDCIVMDLRLPDSSGLEILRKLRSLDKNHQVPAIIYTAMDVSREMEAELRKVADRIILKSGNAMDRLLNETSLFLNWVDSQQENERYSRKERHEDSLSDSLEGRHILMVDDDMRNLYSLSAALEDFGIKITTASNGQEALDFLANDHSIELVLMDIMMPVMDGYEAITRIREQNKFTKLPIIALTAKAMQEDRSRCIEVGANDYFPKPIDVPKLKSVMKVWLRQQ